MTITLTLTQAQLDAVLVTLSQQADGNAETYDDWWARFGSDDSQGHAALKSGQAALADAAAVAAAPKPRTVTLGFSDYEITTSTTGDVHDGCGGVWQAADAHGLIDRCDRCGEERA